jgi:beta-carotene ketolase (CrtO type)
MADAAYDAVIIGGGTKSIVTAIYLAKYGGMSVGVFEERRELCSGLTSEIGFVPGFVADCHATGMEDWYYLPVRDDFPGFEDKGGKIFHLPGHAGIIDVKDHSSWVMYNREKDPSRELTAKGLAQFSSERDVETFWKLTELTNPGSDFELAFLQEIFNPPPPDPLAPSPLETWFLNYLAQPDCLVDYSWLQLPTMQALQRLWERKAIVYLMLRLSIVAGAFLELTPGLGYMMAGFSPWDLGYAVGGTHSVAHAYQRTLHEVGGKWFPFSKVDKIIIENGTAKGIQLADGTEIEAKKVVVSGVSPRQLCIEMIGPDYLSPKILRKVETLVSNIKGLVWYSWFMHELPNYKASNTNPDINQCSHTVLGSEDLSPMYDYLNWCRLGKVGPIDGTMLVHPYTAVDKTRAPEGKHVVAVDSDLPTNTQLSEREWLNLKKTRAQDQIEEWQKYATNMTWDNIIGFNPQLPYDAARRGLNFWPDGNAGVIDVYPGQLGKIGPIPEMAQYRLPGIKNLYHCGSWRFPSGGNCCQGYVCYKVIAGDLGLRKPWEEKERPY